MKSNWSYNPETLNAVQNWQFLSDETLKFDGRPWYTIGHLIYAISSFVHHFIAISQFELELQSVNAKFRWKSVIFVLCDLEIWQMTLKNNRASLLTCFKLCGSFVAIYQLKLELWSRNAQFGTKLAIFCPVWPWHLTNDLEIQKNTFPMPHQALCMISLPYLNSNWSYSLEKAELGFGLCDLNL